MIEMMIAVAAGIFIMSMMMTALSNLTALGKAKREGAQLALGAAAMDAYLKKFGVSIAKNQAVPGFADPLSPDVAVLRNGRYLPSYFPQTTAFGGTLVFRVQKGSKGDLTGLVCDTQNVTERGAPSPALAGEVLMAANGSGLRTSIATPAVLNGPGLTGIASPIIGPAIVCAWAYLANPL
jgi:hypothetical protein